MLSSSGLSAENMNAWESFSFKATIYSSLFGYDGALNSSFLFQLPYASALTEARGLLLAFCLTSSIGRSKTSSPSLSSELSVSSCPEATAVEDPDVCYSFTFSEATSRRKNSSSVLSLTLMAGLFPWLLWRYSCMNWTYLCYSMQSSTYMILRIFNEHLGDKGLKDTIYPVLQVGSLFDLLMLLHFIIF